MNQQPDLIEFDDEAIKFILNRLNQSCRMLLTAMYSMFLI